ncbi:MAG: acetylxylan esterase [Phycisphaeraceae bacterium]|nr:acetylxylan esterase [Phycisphaeraceae bacterium]
MNRICVAAILLLALISMGQATNVDESKVPSYVLPDLMVSANGEPVTTSKQWQAQRRGELLDLFRAEMFGQAPGRPEVHTTKEVVLDALNGLAIRKQVTLRIGNTPDSPELDLLIYLPKKAAIKAPKSVPVFLGLNFQGNHTIHTDPGIRLCRSWLPEKRQATEASRGRAASRWPVETILAQGFGLATLYYGDIDPDFHRDEFTNGVHALYPELQQQDDNFTAIGAWAWGLSRAMDALENDPHVNAQQVAVIGHSRLGKTALWAGATDERFALVISNDSGSGGAALFRRCFGERIHNLNSNFPHWFSKRFKRYDNKEHSLPFDQHMLIALMAPRPVYVASATRDTWADPKGEFLAAHAAGPAYRLFGHVGLPSNQWPAPDHPVQGRIGYHLRTGKHDLAAYDWTQYMAFAKAHWSNDSPKTSGITTR